MGEMILHCLFKFGNLGWDEAHLQPGSFTSLPASFINVWVEMAMVVLLVLFVFPNCCMCSTRIIIEKKSPESCQRCGAVRFFQLQLAIFSMNSSFSTLWQTEKASLKVRQQSQPQSTFLTLVPLPVCCSNFYYSFLFSQKLFWFQIGCPLYVAL